MHNEAQGALEFLHPLGCSAHDSRLPCPQRASLLSPAWMRFVGAVGRDDRTTRCAAPHLTRPRAHLCSSLVWTISLHAARRRTGPQRMEAHVFNLVGKMRARIKVSTFPCARPPSPRQDALEPFAWNLSTCGGRGTTHACLPPTLAGGPVLECGVHAEPACCSRASSPRPRAARARARDFGRATEAEARE